MNYRHFYHAGNFADVFKHSILMVILNILKQKDKGFCYIDTHAGVGGYDLRREETQRSQEYLDGIAKLLKAPHPPAELARYIELVKAYQNTEALHGYPGSPLVAKHFLRPQDQMIVNEFHPDDFQDLKYTLGKSPQIHCHHRDAYEFLPAILPPTLGRGLILIDPPYEKTDEFAAITDCLETSIKRFRNGIYMIWYPIVSLSHRAFTRQILRAKWAPTLVTELTVTAIPEVKSGMIGCGIVVLNPPWKSESAISSITDYLAGLFQRDESGYHRTEFVE